MDENKRSAFDVYRQQQEENEEDSEELSEECSVTVSRYVDFVYCKKLISLVYYVRERFHVSVKFCKGEVPRRRDGMTR